MFGRKFGFKGPFMMEKIPHAIGNQILSLKCSFGIVYSIGQKYVSANLGFGFGIGPKPKQWFRSYTTQKQLAINYTIFFDTVDFSFFQEAKPISKLIFFHVGILILPLYSGQAFLILICILFYFIQLFHPFFILQNKLYHYY